VINRYIEQLRSSDPKVRREAIIALGKSHDAAALRPLADVYRTDSDPSLRELALKAGRYLRQQTDGFPSAAAAPVGAATLTAAERLQQEIDAYEADEHPTKPEPLARQLNRRPVTEQDIKNSKSFVDAALSANIKGDNPRALRALKKALEINPDIKDDGYFSSIAGAVTGRSGQEAITLILDSGKARQFEQESRRQQRSAKTAQHLETTVHSTWGAVGLEALIYLLINTAAPIIVLLVSVEAARSYLAAELVESEQQLANLAVLLTSIGPGVAFLNGVITGIIGTASVALHGLLNHSIITLLFQGKGTLPHTLDRMYSFYNRRLPIVWVLSLAGVSLTLSARAPLFGALLSLAAGLYSLRILFELVGLTARAYDRSTMIGCVTNLISLIMLGFISVIIQVTLGAALLSVLFAGMPIDGLR
jgi:hypothetical protein